MKITSQSGPVHRSLPSHIQQMLVVSRYEILKHLRSKRLIGTVAIAALIVALIYALPPLLGSPYTGHVDQTLEVQPIPSIIGSAFGPNTTYANLSEGNIQLDTLYITVDGIQIPDTLWAYESSMNAVIFFQNYTSNTVVAHFDFKRGTNSFTENFLGFVPILVVICAIFFGSDVLVSEYQNRTAYLLFPNPIRREVLFAGKIIASFVASFLIIGLFYGALSILSFATLGEIAKYLYLSFGFATLYLLGCLGVAYFISAIMKGSTGAIIFTFFLLIMILPIISGVGAFAGTKMWFSLDFVSTSISTSLRFDHYPVDSVYDIGGFTIYNYYPDLGLSIMVMLAYLVIFSILSLILFKKKQLLG